MLTRPEGLVAVVASLSVALGKKGMMRGARMTTGCVVCAQSWVLSCTENTFGTPQLSLSKGLQGKDHVYSAGWRVVVVFIGWTG